MRAGLGILSLLLVTAVIFYAMFGMGGGGTAGTALNTAKEVKPQVEQIAGRDIQGKPVEQTITLDTNDKGVIVVAVEPGGAMEQKFGFKPGDVIVEIPPLVKEQFADAKTASAYLVSAYQTNGTVVVLRGGDLRLTLPQPAAPGAIPAPVQRTTPRGQLDDILKRRPENIPTH